MSGPDVEQAQPCAQLYVDPCTQPCAQPRAQPQCAEPPAQPDRWMLAPVHILGGISCLNLLHLTFAHSNLYCS